MSEKTAPSFLCDENYDRIATLMLGTNETTGELDPNATESFSVMMHDADAFIFTAYSAVPIADALRAYYETIGKPIPLLDYVMANGYYSRRAPRGIRELNLADESDRLKLQLENVNHACVVDEYCYTVATLQYASMIVRECGVSEVSTLAGQWYHQTNSQEVHLDRMTSAHESFMAKVGRLAAEHTKYEHGGVAV